MKPKRARKPRDINLLAKEPALSSHTFSLTVRGWNGCQTVVYLNNTLIDLKGAKRLHTWLGQFLEWSER